MKITELAKLLNIAHDPDLTDEGVAKIIKASYDKLVEASAKASEKPADTKTDTKPEAVAASGASGLPPEVTAQLTNLTRTNRAMQIDSLLTSAKITADQHKTLKGKWAGETLSLSDQPAFDSVFEVLNSNPPLKGVGQEKSGKQTAIKAGEGDNKVSPLVAQRQKAQNKA